MVSDVWINVRVVYGYNIYKTLHFRKKKKLMYVLSEVQMSELIESIKEGVDIDVSKYKKRSRSRSLVKSANRCSAKRADGAQCSRQRKDGELYCGTHIKGCPHGIFEIKSVKEELKLTIKEYKGIAYYIDLDSGDVYSSEDIQRKRNVARVVGKYKNGEVIIKKSQ